VCALPLWVRLRGPRQIFPPHRLKIYNPISTSLPTNHQHLLHLPLAGSQSIPPHTLVASAVASLGPSSRPSTAAAPIAASLQRPTSSSGNFLLPPLRSFKGRLAPLASRSLTVLCVKL
jgi:hypothetical protein